MIPELKDTMCITQILGPQNGGYSPLTKAECEEIADQGYGNLKAYCHYDGNDYWAGAVKACGGVQNMPTMEQLGQLATYLYNYDGTIGDQQDISSGISLDTTKASQFLSASPYSTYFYVWSGQEYSKNGAYLRGFYPTDTGWGNNLTRLNSAILAVCLDQ